MSGRTIETQVAIVGAGPTGITVANYLGMYGVDTVVIDRATEIIDYPRAVGMDDECLRSFQGVGLADELVHDMIQNVPLRFFDAGGRCFADIQPSTQEFGWSRRNIFMQQLCERVLRRGLRRYPCVELLTGHDVVRLRQERSGVDLEVLAPDGGRVRVRAGYVVGADGGRSTIREQLGIVLDGDTHPRRWVVIECDNDPIDAPYTGLHCDPARPYVCIHLPHDYRRWEFMLFPGEDDQEMLKPDMVRHLLARHVDDPDRLNIIRARVYTHHSRIARRFTAGRVCLVGDAAHLMPPWAGQGMNTGIRDATNLAWKIAAVVQGRAHPSLLETYDSERRAHAKAMIDLSTTLGRILSPTNPAVAFARDVAFRAVTWAPAVKNWILQMRFKPMPRYTDGVVVTDERSRTSPVGRMFIQPRVEAEDGAVVRLDDVLGPWFAVLGYDTDPAEHLGRDHRAFLDSLDTSYIKIVASRSRRARNAARDPDTTVVEDLDGQLRAWFTQHRGRVVILRPDRYVAAVADEDDLGRAVDRLRRLLDPAVAGWTPTPTGGTA